MDAPFSYDRTSRDSILAYAERLVGRSLREVLSTLPPRIDFSAHKGGFGTALERYYFGYVPNSRPGPDFPEAGVELKATPVKSQGRHLVAKERLVLGMIDYMTIVSEEWETSSFLSKSAHLLLIFYLHEEGKDPRDFVVKIVRLWDFPDEDLEIIRDDWQTIVDKVRAGRAHEISEGDTLYLAACTKGAKGTDRRTQPHSTHPAKPRALSLKASYMNSIISDSLRRQQGVASIRELRSGLTFEDIVHERFRPYLGLTADEIAVKLGVRIKRGAKNFYAVLTKGILGVDADSRVAEFEKAGLMVRTIRLKPNGVPKEAVSFPAFDYIDLVTQTWETSDLRSDLTRRFFFVVFQLEKDGTPRLARTQFWTMPHSDLETYGRRCFEDTVCLIREDKADYLPSSKQNPACHVRPHGRDRSDTLPTPSGRRVVRKSFWLNQKYLADQLKGETDT